MVYTKKKSKKKVLFIIIIPEAVNYSEEACVFELMTEVAMNDSVAVEKKKQSKKSEEK